MVADQGGRVHQAPTTTPFRCAGGQRWGGSTGGPSMGPVAGSWLSWKSAVARQPLWYLVGHKKLKPRGGKAMARATKGKNKPTSPPAGQKAAQAVEG